MPKKEAPVDAIKRFIPEAAVGQVLEYLHHYKVHLTVTRDRKSVLGDYRHATGFQAHRISVNGSLNKYSFLITLIHELAHLVTFMKFRHRVEPHGREWKNIYAEMLKDFMHTDVFPQDLLDALKRSIHDLPASSCSDENLMRSLKKYDLSDGKVMVEQIGEGGLFETGRSQVFKKGKKLRKRYQCQELATGRLYLFSPIYEVKPYERPVG